MIQLRYSTPVDKEIPKSPYIKPKGFLARLIPIVIHGIPLYADSVRDPSVVGTLEYEKFWNEELNRIINGFWIGDIWIPGRFYYYMNYKHMSTIKGVITPDMVDLHLELAYHIEYCLANGKNLLVAKGRRKGISEATSTMIVDYGWRFFEGFKAGVAAGSKTYVEDFVDKWRFSDSRLPPELSVKKLVDNNDEIVAGYSIKNRQGAYEEKGTFNTIYARTMHTNPNMFKGLYLNAIISEEVGEHERWIEFYGASKDCLRSGNQQVGILVAFGTAGNINKGSKDFKRIWNEPETFNFVKFMIPATRFNLYGGSINHNQVLPAESELLKKYKDWQVIGCEDLVLSEKNILKQREVYVKEGNMQAFNEDMQNNPLNTSEMFKKTVLNNFDITKLNTQQSIVDNLEHQKYTKYKLEWVKDDKGMIKIPLEVKAIPLESHDSSDEYICIIDGEMPRKGHSNLHVAGLDSYDQDVAKASKSLGAMVIRIRNNNIPLAMKNAPVAVISCRPRRKELFYDLTLKASVFFNLVGNVLVDVGAGLVMEYYRECGGWKYLADRPRKFESEKSEQSHEKGVRLTNFSRPRMSGLMQTDILENSQNYWFGKSGDPCDLINQLGNFDEVEIGSDNDAADAHGLSLMQDVSCDVKPRNDEEHEITDRFDLPMFVPDGFGGMKLQRNIPGNLNPNQDSEFFGLMFGHDK